MKAKAPTATKANGNGGARVNFKVSMTLPAGVKAKDIQEFIDARIRSADRGPAIDHDTLKVTRIYDSRQ